MNGIDTRFWLRISLFNLCIVAALGVLMRYKIEFELPYFDQKFVQHAHSHFAFSGWVSHTIFALLVSFLLSVLNVKEPVIKYHKLIVFNLICAYGMLFSFAIQGYGPVAISFSTLSILNSFLFAYHYLKDLTQISDSHASKKWFIAALIFNVISAAGTFSLAYMMMSRNLPQHLYLASVYFYLHFQYNGWFFFSCMGFFVAFLQRKLPDLKVLDQIFWLMACSCVPAYFLSTLWADLPLWLYLIVVAGSIGQLLGWAIFLHFIYINILQISKLFKPVLQFLLFLLALTITIKLLLQLGSTIPVISKLAFGFRSIVIAYLHLVLLGIISLFLLVYSIAMNFFKLPGKTALFSLLIFVSCIFLIELILAIQGIASFTYTLIPFSNELLLTFTIALFIGAAVFLKSQYRGTK